MLIPNKKFHYLLGLVSLILLAILIVAALIYGIQASYPSSRTELSYPVAVVSLVTSGISFIAFVVLTAKTFKRDIKIGIILILLLPLAFLCVLFYRLSVNIIKILELLNLTLADRRWGGPRLKELACLRDEICLVLCADVKHFPEISARGLQKYFLSMTSLARRRS